MTVVLRTTAPAAMVMAATLFTRLLVIFGGFAMLLACIGLHGVTSYAVARRTSEIGIRIALSAGPAIASMLYGLAPRDVTTMVGAAALLVAVALGAGWLPARRASRMPVLSALTRE